MARNFFVFSVTLFACGLFAIDAGAQSAPAAAAQSSAQSTPSRVALKLKSGTIVVGTVVSESADETVIDAGPLGKITVKASEIAGHVDPALVEAVGAPPPPPAAAAPNAGTIFTAPGQTRWTRSIDVQGSYNSAIYKQGAVTGVALTGKQLGLTGQQYTTNAALAIARATSRNLAYFNSAYSLAVFEPQGTVARMPSASTGLSHQTKDDARYFYTARYEWYKDIIRHIDYSHQAFIGVGIHAKKTAKVQIDLVPLVGGLIEKKGTKYDGDLLTGMGGVWQLTYKPNPIVTIDHRETFHAAFTDWNYRGLESYAGFRGAVGAKLGVTIGLTHTYDKALEQTFLTSPAFPGVQVFANNSSFIRLTTGLHIGF